MNSVCAMPLLKAMLLSSSVPLSKPPTHSPHCCEHSYPKHTAFQISVLQVIMNNAVQNMLLSFTFMLGKPVGVKYWNCWVYRLAVCSVLVVSAKWFSEVAAPYVFVFHLQCVNSCSISNHWMNNGVGYFICLVSTYLLSFRSQLFSVQLFAHFLWAILYYFTRTFYIFIFRMIIFCQIKY